jgi:ribosomal protein L17
MAGNANSGRRSEKPFADALRMELAAAGSDHKALRKIANMLIEKATEGDMAAIKEVIDRTDGKAVQAIEGDLHMSADESIAGLFARVASQGTRLIAAADDSADQ